MDKKIAKIQKQYKEKVQVIILLSFNFKLLNKNPYKVKEAYSLLYLFFKTIIISANKF